MSKIYRKNIYKPDHPNSYNNGNIPEYVYLTSLKLNRPLIKGKEIVHHIDGNQENNDLDNLIVLASRSDHNILHAHNLDLSILTLLPNGSYKVKDNIPKIYIKIYRCEYCSKEFEASAYNHKKKHIFCSKECADKSQERFDVTVEQLKELVQNNSLVQIGKMFGVSGNAIKKRCLRYNINWKKG